MQTTVKEEQPINLKRKLISALAMLLVATTLMTTTSYAWFILSTAPEVTGISTNVGANGSLEIALLTTQTRSNMASIRAGIGDSLAANNLAANNAWGNLVDLGFTDYGLSGLMLMPSRLNVAQSGDGYTVDPGLLAVPTYGYDGRIIELTDNTMSAIYKESQFSFNPDIQDYGVRAIGTSDTMTPQSSSLAIAKSNISSSTESARNNAKLTLENASMVLFDIVTQHYMNPDQMYTDGNKLVLKNMLDNLQKSVSDIDSALRQGLIAAAASQIDDEEMFNVAKDRVMDTSIEVKQIVGEINGVVSVPGDFVTWAEALDEMQNDLNAANNACNEMVSGSYTWQEIRGVLDYIMNIEGVMIGESTFDKLDMNELLAMPQVEMILAPGSGIFADLAEFIGNYNALMTLYEIKPVEVKTGYNEDLGVYLKILVASVKDLSAAGGLGSSNMTLTATYGYALDLAFRCNTAGADLVLQTIPKQRVYSESESASTQGGGSYMEFTGTDLESRLELMDGIRVGFLDKDGKILSIAKLNTSNYVMENGVIYAPLYLYDYTFEQDETGLYLTMGERHTENNAILPAGELGKNEPVAVTVVVWLDGDVVDNTMVSATESASLNGVLNLQFSTNAELVPSRNAALLDYTADKSGLEAVLLEYEELYVAGQRTYTTVSWNAFFNAYNRALLMIDGDDVSQTKVRNSMMEIVRTAAALETVSQEPVVNKIAQLREQMGETEDLVNYVVRDKDGNIITAGSEEHTQEEHDSWDVVGEIKRVDYQQNLWDEGNDIYTPIYTDESWSALAGALYEAERLAKDENATDEQLNAALTAIEVSEKALQRNVFYRPYEYKGAIYYEAIYDAGNEDTYGKWYDSSFKRIVSDIMILNLDAYAVPASVSKIDQNEYVSNKTSGISPQVQILDQVYAELQEEEIIGVKWGIGEGSILEKSANENHVTALNNLLAIVEAENLAASVSTTEAESLLTRIAEQKQVSMAEAETAIENLNNAITEALELRQESQTTHMTASQRILLTSAVNSAMALEGYDGNGPLKSAVTNAQSKLESASTTRAAADAALAQLNAQLQAAGAKEVTEYNTLTHKIPESSDTYDVVYDVEYPGINMNVTGKSGNETLTAKILTKNGVIITVTKNIVVYTPADGLELMHNGQVMDAKTGLELEAGRQTNMAARLFYGETVNNLDEIEVPENIKSLTWASSDTSVAEIVGKDAKTCTIQALAEGVVTISVSAETVEGNAYATQFQLSVKPSGEILP